MHTALLRHDDVTPSSLPPWPMRTRRLVLRAATEADAERTWIYRRLDSVGRWLTALAPDLVEYSRAFVEPERLEKTIVVELDGVVIGDLMLAVEDAWAQTEVADLARHTQAELGWALDPGHAGRGYATEAVEALLKVCFVDLGLRRVTAACFAENESSWRLMERVGMRRESVAVRDALHRDGTWRDSYTYALLAIEWNGDRS